MGSPEFALPVLRQLAAHYFVAGVVTQPDRPAGRGQEMSPPPVKKLAESLGLPIIQPTKLRQPEAWEKLTSWKPDLIVVAAFGQILRQNILDLPQFGCINVHASLLPRWRGASPIQAAIAAGDPTTGVTIMKMDAGIDTGDILAQAEIQIRPEDTAPMLEERLSILGGDLLIDVLPRYLDGEIHARPQPSEGALYAPMLKKEDGYLNFQLPAVVLERRVRAYQPWPGTSLVWEGGNLKVIRARVVQGETEPGRRTVLENLPAVGTVEGWLILEEVQPAGKKPMRGDQFLNGARSWKQVNS